MEDLQQEHSTDIDYSIVIPVYNAAGFIDEVVTEVVAYFATTNHSYEIICVNDRSTDSSWEVIKNLKQKYKVVRGLNLMRNFGQHNATCAGFAKSKGKQIITLDDDLEVHPKEIEKLIQTYTAKNSKVVYGHFENVERKGLRKAFKKVYQLAARIFEGKSRVNGSSFRLVDGDIARKVAKEATFFVFVDEAILWYTEDIAFAEVNHQKSKRGKSNYSIFGLFTLTGEVVLFSSIIPLRAVKIIGFSIASINFVIGLFYFVKWMTGHISEAGYASLIISVLFSTGLIIFILGILGEYLSKMYRIMNRRPVYAIDEEI